MLARGSQYPALRQEQYDVVSGTWRHRSHTDTGRATMSGLFVSNILVGIAYGCHSPTSVL